MLNEEKIRLMTGISMFEKKMMKESIPANRYFKSDYVGSHLIRSFIAYSLTVCLCLLLWVLYRFDDLINAMAVDDLISLGVRLVFYYAAGLIAKLSRVEIPEDIKPEELLALLSEQIPMLTPADEKEKYLFGMVADYRPEDVYDEQMRELLDWGRTEKYLWTVTLPDDWQNA